MPPFVASAACKNDSLYDVTIGAQVNWKDLFAHLESLVIQVIKYLFLNVYMWEVMNLRYGLNIDDRWGTFFRC